MKRFLGVLLLCCLTVPANAVVYINEVFINPPGGADNVAEYIELRGTPGKKLDGYALGLLNGTQAKYRPIGAGLPSDQEIDEFFSLDGLSLGENGILVIANGVLGDYPTVLNDTNFQNWDSIWNGPLDTPGKLNNDGSNTVVLIRNRPGQTEADPTNPLGLRWAKDVDHDQEFFHNVTDPQNPGLFEQWGDGNIDKGDFSYDVCIGGTDDGLSCGGGCPGGFCRSGSTLDLKGASTMADDTDDLEVVDEISYEHERGWEYDLDSRHVDDGSTVNGLPYRHVHALDDPQGFNPDCLTRVDYRTKGNGWTPATGGTGEMGNGNNWQDTATEQWIRGESVPGPAGYYYDNSTNTNPDAIQPYETNVPLWLDDSSAPDYDFTTSFSYQIMAGRINPFEITFVPGDTDRDGDSDTDDITKVAAVFGDDDWIFSNSFSAAPEGDGGDPATQTRPWDVDLSGPRDVCVGGSDDGMECETNADCGGGGSCSTVVAANGIEASDLQWVLNFQGDTTGQVVGVDYDGSGPAATGVYLNDYSTVSCTVTSAYNVLSARTLSTLQVGDLVELTVSAQVTGGAITSPAAEQNGVMQFVNDVLIDTADVIKVVDVQAMGVYSTTRASIQTLEGTDGDEGISTVNGYTTSFDQGLSSAVNLYKVTLQAKSIGSADVSVQAADAAKFKASTPQGLKVGHTDHYGNPNAASYPASQGVSVTTTVCADRDMDGDIDATDVLTFVNCSEGPAIAYGNPGTCSCLDYDIDGDIDSDDYGVFQRCYTGSGGTPDQDCDQ
jgi:hypothetical protein